MKFLLFVLLIFFYIPSFSQCDVNNNLSLSLTASQSKTPFACLSDTTLRYNNKKLTDLVAGGFYQCTQSVDNYGIIPISYVWSDNNYNYKGYLVRIFQYIEPDIFTISTYFVNDICQVIGVYQLSETDPQNCVDSPTLNAIISIN